MKPNSIEDYIDLHDPAVQKILRRVHATVKKAAPKADEKISYGMPTLVQNGHLIYFGAFKKHIGLFPPVADAALRKASKKYANEKGNLAFPYDEPIPYGLIAKITKARVKENAARKAKRKA